MQASEDEPSAKRNKRQGSAVDILLGGSWGELSDYGGGSDPWESNYGSEGWDEYGYGYRYGYNDYYDFSGDRSGSGSGDYYDDEDYKK